MRHASFFILRDERWYYYSKNGHFVIAGFWTRSIKNHLMFLYNFKGKIFLLVKSMKAMSPTPVISLYEKKCLNLETLELKTTIKHLPN